MSEKDIENLEKIDKVMAYVLMRKFVVPIRQSKAFELGLIDREGKIIKSPETEEERRALTLVDRFLLKIKRMLGSKVAQLNAFMYTKSTQIDLDKSFINKGSVDKRAVVKRVKDDMIRLLERYEMSEDEFYHLLLAEEIKDKEVE